MKSNLVSIITPSYMAGSYLADTIDSVLLQTYENWEMLVVDDCSPDKANELVERYAEKDSRIRLLKLTKNSGAAVARNAAIEEAKGRYIAFLDSDDQWLPEKLERQVRFMQEFCISFSYTAYEKQNAEGKLLGSVGVPPKVCYRDLLKVCSIGCLTAMYDAHALGKIYMPLIRKRQDLGLWLRILRKTPYAYGLDEVLARYRLHGNSISANKREAAKYTWHLYRHVEKLSFPMASYFFCHYAFNGLLRTKLPSLARALGKL